jgi:hypothetical protein
VDRHPPKIAASKVVAEIDQWPNPPVNVDRIKRLKLCHGAGIKSFHHIVLERLVTQRMLEAQEPQFIPDRMFPLVGGPAMRGTLQSRQISNEASGLTKMSAGVSL